jgi:hypothetical protein
MEEKRHKLGQQLATLKIALYTLQEEQAREILKGDSGITYSTPIKYLLEMIKEKQDVYKEARQLCHTLRLQD